MVLTQSGISNNVQFESHRTPFFRYFLELYYHQQWQSNLVQSSLVQYPPLFSLFTIKCLWPCFLQGHGIPFYLFFLPACCRRERRVGESLVLCLFCSQTLSVLVVVCSPADTLVIDQLVFWCLFFSCILMYSHRKSAKKERGGAVVLKKYHIIIVAKCFHYYIPPTK